MNLRYTGRVVVSLIMVIRAIMWTYIIHKVPLGFNWHLLLVAEAIVAWGLGWHYDKVRFYAQKDSLTLAYNRRFIESVFPKLVARSDRNHSPLAVMLIDVDDLKRINDRFGHKQGDMTIKRVANIVFERIRSADFVVRWGGDEFVIVAPDTGADAAGQIAGRIVSELQRSNTTTGEVRASVSVGVAIYPENGHTFETLLDFADVHMYRAKAAARPIFQDTEP